MIGKLLKDNKTLLELIIGIIAYNLVIQIVLAIFFEQKLYCAIGLWSGALTASLMAIHMAYCLEKTLSLDEKGAGGFSKRMTIVRYIGVCVILALIGVFKLGNPLCFVFGALGLKFGAYLQPLTHRLASKFYREDIS